jgi:hypothetical protein
MVQQFKEQVVVAVVGIMVLVPLQVELVILVEQVEQQQLTAVMEILILVAVVVELEQVDLWKVVELVVQV